VETGMPAGSVPAYHDRHGCHTMNKTQIPQLVAHRGYLTRFPENTWRGLRAALDAGAEWLEFDIQLCRDGEYVLLHDAGFLRTAGVKRAVFDMDSRHIDISVHEPARFGRLFEPTPVATLVEVLENLVAYPGVRVMVELKQESIDHWGLDSVMPKLMPLLVSHQPRCVLISFNRKALQWCRNQYPEVRIGWVLRRYDAKSRELANALNPDYLICNEKKISQAQTPWRGPWRWMLYDIVDPNQALHWARRGVDMIETADIASMLRDPRLTQHTVSHVL